MSNYKSEEDRFDHSTCTICGTTFLGVLSFDAHRPCDGTGHLANNKFVRINSWYVLISRADAYREMAARVAKAREARK